MFAALKSLPSLGRRGIIQRRNYYGYVGRRREELSIAESWAHGLLIAGGIFTIPAWVLCHIKEYRGIDKKE
ncbi:hypothetical protein CEXT_554911 [Caerostris extrusa]|uniref:Uncharacterized protein n=1 Tax=Caerostris extrusa TaxID=172846 RepID=A0AAV4UE22_CAEEX|nr:hypothetical protein CEXT_554911 [Caerostris extrusa]